MKPNLWIFPADWTFIVVGVLVGVAVCWTIGARWGLSRSRFVLVQIFLSFMGLAGSKLQSLLERDSFGDLTLELSSGFRYVGGVAAALLGLIVLQRLKVIKIDALKVLDSGAPAICAAMAVVRIGCFLEGCCFGTVTDGSLGMRFPVASPAWRAQVAHGILRADAQYSLPVHPLQLYFLLWSAGLFLALWSLSRRQLRSGTVFLCFVFADGIARFLFEPFRFEPVRANAWVGLAAGLLALILLLRRAFSAGAVTAVASQR